MPKEPKTAVVALESEDTRERVLDAAARLFSERGYEAASLKQIAAAVGVSAPALYWHFESKAVLLHAVIDRSLRRFTRTILAAQQSATTPRERLAALVRAYVLSQLRQVADAEAYSNLYAPGHLMSVLSEESRSEFRALENQTFNALRDTVREGVTLGVFTTDSPTFATRAIVSIGEDSANWFEYDGEMNEEQFADRVVGLVERIVGVS
ncbi:AcrR family transcriptional regulator [Rhodococcus sp. OAS809]|uniref:TetR/AcrR family transcriptional regulator n=1 Tax=Rhodococcus sp. OAS809 TaxID=2663874 RepID=UPI00178BAFD2